MLAVFTALSIQLAGFNTELSFRFTNSFTLAVEEPLLASL